MFKGLSLRLTKQIFGRGELDFTFVWSNLKKIANQVQTTYLFIYLHFIVDNH